MSPTAFENLEVERPELRAALVRLRRWVEQNPQARFLDPRRLASEIHDVSSSDLSTTLTILAQRGRLQRAYKVLAPTNGVLADGSFTSPLDIPPRLKDSCEDWFLTKDGTLVVIFHEAKGE